MARASDAPLSRERLERWLASKAHGDMEWMERTAARRGSPLALWPRARAIIVVGANYGAACDPLANLREPRRAALSLYARRNDYHDIMKGRLKQLASFLLSRSGAGEAKVFVDTAPVMEKPLAQAAGVGWQGKHTNIVSRRFGSWLFLGSIFTDIDLEPDAPETDRCGTCRKCLDACPTRAFPAPYQLDARRCISYLTIEHKGPIAREFRRAIGNRIFGCDDCLAVCPWNKFARQARDAKLGLREEFENLELAALARLDEPGFRALFARTPIKRLGHDRFLRNVAIALGNSEDAELASGVLPLLAHASPLVRGAAAWALARLLPRADFIDLAKRWRASEPDPEVSAEWDEELRSSDGECEICHTRRLSRRSARGWMDSGKLSL